jgi:hypothetical protein
VLYYAIAMERVKRHFLISNVSVGNMLPMSYRLGRPVLDDSKEMQQALNVAHSLLEKSSEQAAVADMQTHTSV